MPNYRPPLIAITSVILVGTIYSVIYDTYLDTSNPLLSHLPHPLRATHYWANKSNWMNVYFIKQAWGWTTLAFLSSLIAYPVWYHISLTKYLIETGVWMTFTSWFFGPSLLERLLVASGGECFLPIPNGEVLTVPYDHCYQRDTLGPDSHPQYFTSSGEGDTTDWRGRPRFRQGHDVSGHIFLLTMSILFLWDSMQPLVHARKKNAVQWVALALNYALIALWLFACYTTSVYFHTPFEKLTGYLLGVFGFALTQFFLPSIQQLVAQKGKKDKEPQKQE